MKRIKRITKGTLKYFIAPFLLLILFIAASFITLILLFPRDKALDIVQSEAERIIGQKVSIERINYGIGGIYLKNVSIVDIANNQPIVRCDSIRLSISLRALLSKTILISDISLNNPEITLSYTENKWNIESVLDKLLTKTTSVPTAPEKIQTKIKHIDISNCTINLQSTPNDLTPFTGKYIVSLTILEPTTLPLTIENVKISLPQNRGIISTKSFMIKENMNEVNVVGEFNLEEVTLPWLFNWLRSPEVTYKSVSGTLRNGFFSEKVVTGNFEGQVVLANNQACSTKAAFSSIIENDHQDLKLTDMEITTGRSKINLAYLTLSPSISFSANSISSNNADLAVLVPDFPRSILFGVNGSVFYSAKSYSADLVFTNVEFSEDGYSIKCEKLPVSTKNGTFSIDNLPISLNGFPSYLSATTGRSVNDISINLVVPKYEIKSKQSQNSSENNSNKQISAPDFTGLPYSIKGSILVKNFMYDDLPLNDISLIFATTPSGITIPRFSAQFYESSLSGNTTISLRKNNPSIDSNFNISNFKIQRISQINKEFTGRFYGVAQCRGHFIFNPFSSNPIEKSLQGKIDFSVTNGKIANTGLQNQLGIFLDALKYKLSDLEFNTIKGSIAVNNSNFLVQSIIFNAPDIRLSASGTISNNDMLETKLTLEFNNTFIQDLPNPALLTLNKYKIGKWFTIHILTKGEISKGKHDIKIIE